MPRGGTGVPGAVKVHTAGRGPRMLQEAAQTRTRRGRCSRGERGTSQDGGCPGGKRRRAGLWDPLTREEMPRRTGASWGSRPRPHSGGGGGRCLRPGAGRSGRARVAGGRPAAHLSPRPGPRGRRRGGAAGPGRAGRWGREAPGAQGGGGDGSPAAAALRPAGRAVRQRRRESRGSVARLRPARWDNAALSGRKQPPRAASADAAPVCAHDYAAAAAGVRGGARSTSAHWPSLTPPTATPPPHRPMPRPFIPRVPPPS